jgi:hypothetical protein|tara:strand:- start:642 stop:2288 length:1647 start_codon:yes stop_codon:yes gene_type:complete
MATYVNNLRLKEIATGDEAGTWGTSTNTNLELVGEGLGFGTEAITTNADTHASTVADGSADEARAMYIKYTGTLDSACTITIGPNTLKRVHFIENGTSGSQNIIIKQGSGSTVTIGPGDVKVVYLDGAGSGAAVNDAFASLSTVDLKVSDDLTVTDDASVGGDLLVSGEVQTANIGFTDGDNAITIADGGGITAAAGITSTAASNTFGATSFNDANITNVGDIALDSLSADGSSISIASPVVINGSTPTLTIGDAGEEDTKLVFDGNAQDFYIGLDDSADDLLIGNGSTVGSNVAIGVNESQVVQFNGAYTFPTSDGSADQVLKTNGSGALSFGTVSAGTPTSIADADGDTKVQCEESSDEDKIRFDTGGSETASIISTGLLVGGGFSGGMFENEACNIRKSGSNDDAVLALDSDTGDASFYRFIRFYRKNTNSSLAKLDYDLSGDSISLAVESDERYKTITGPADGWNLISKLEPIKYTRPSEGVTNGCGFGAQSYKQAFDDIGEYARGVTEGSDTEKWMLDYSVLVPNLVKTIQELEARIATLEGS